jgi:anti-sigma-K factor RskA
MSHVSEEVLAALALGDPDVSPDEREHVDSCPVCAEEVAELASVHGLLREEVGMRGAHRVEPGPAVWEGILAATSDDVVAEGSTAPPVSEPEPLRTIEPRPAAATAGRRRSPRSRWWVVAAAAACVLIGALVGRAVWAPGETTQPVVASVPLTTLDATKQQEGTAQLIGGQGGQGQELKVDTRPMSPGSGFVEVWLINTDGKRMVSLGVLSGTEATFPVPADAIAQGYRIVDLSREQFDDKPQHSGDSLMRGTLPV